MTTDLRPHISVCICTYRRAKLLGDLLEKLSVQETDGLFSYSIVVADNDRSGSAAEVVSAFRNGSSMEITYCVEPEQNIALARNRALANATGDFIAFIDDDEFPTNRWLLTLFKTCVERNVDGVLGPVKPYFEQEPPQWLVRGKFYDRPSYPTGLVIDWRKGRTGNVLLKRDLFAPGEQAFRPEFLTGEDQDFFRRMIQKGGVFIWCDEALAYEIVPPIRWKGSFIFRRAFFRGKMSLMHPSFGCVDTARSVMAIVAYAVAMPILLLLGRHIVMLYLDKAFFHLGKLMAAMRLDPIKEKYITE